MECRVEKRKEWKEEREVMEVNEDEGSEACLVRLLQQKKARVQ